MIDIVKAKNNRKYLGTEIEISGRVIGTFATNMGWWLKLTDDKGIAIFVFSPKYNFNPGETIIARGVVQKSDAYGVYLQGTRILRKDTSPVKVVNRYIYVPVQKEEQKPKKTSLIARIDPRLMIAVSVAVSLVAGFLLYPLLS